MIILGLSAFFHDSAAAIILDGKILASCTEERLSLIKHDRSFPKLAIDACLLQTGLTTADIDRIVFYENPYEKFYRVLHQELSNFPRSPIGFAKKIREWLSTKLWIKERISRELNINPQRIDFVPHHLSHAAQAFCTSPFSEAAILIVDAIGEKSCTSLMYASTKSGFKMQTLLEIDYPHSLGLLYAAFTAFCGFKVNDGECSTMALAGFGSPRYVEKIEALCKSEHDGTYSLDPSYFDFDKISGLPFTKKFIQEFGEPRPLNEPLPFACMMSSAEHQKLANSQYQYYADIAASVQFVLEQRLISLCNKLQALTNSENLVFAGGVALNCVANSKLVPNTSFKNIYIPPDPGDGGGAFGAALYKSFQEKPTLHPGRLENPYLGLEYKAVEDIEIFKQFSRTGKMSAVHHMEDEERLTNFVSDHIADGGIVGWFQGRFECGPRALGHRSILVNPANEEAHRLLSSKVKKRAGFRPYGVSVTDQSAQQLFESDQIQPNITRWMQSSIKVRPEFLPQIRQATHFDATTRPQIIQQQENPRFYNLLNKVGQKQNGLAAVTNTSFNPSGFPLVSSPAEAFTHFLTTPMTLLVLDNWVVTKQGG